MFKKFNKYYVKIEQNLNYKNLKYLKGVSQSVIKLQFWNINLENASLAVTCMFIWETRIEKLNVVQFLFEF